MTNHKQNNIIKPKNYILQGPTVIQIQEADIPYTFFTSDLHIQHKNILHFTRRGSAFADVDDMNAKLLDNINNTLPAKSSEHIIRLFHCGDLFFGNKSQSCEKLEYIQNAIKDSVNEVYAVVGNHDVNNILTYHTMIPVFGFNTTDIHCNTQWFWNNMFIVEILRNTKVISRFTVSHFPMDEFHGKFNIHGHLHSEPGTRPGDAENQAIIDKYRNTGTHFDCGVDNNNYIPVSLADIMENKTSITINHGLIWQYTKPQ